MTLFAALIAAAFVGAEGGEVLRLFQTTGAKGFREIATSGFTIHPYPAVEALDVDAAKPKHEFLALGAALTDASAWVLANMPAERRESLMRDLFTPAGCNLGAIRLNIGASDYSTGLYTYDDTMTFKLVNPQIIGRYTVGDRVAVVPCGDALEPAIQSS